MLFWGSSLTCSNRKPETIIRIIRLKIVVSWPHSPMFCKNWVWFWFSYKCTVAEPQSKSKLHFFTAENYVSHLIRNLHFQVNSRIGDNSFESFDWNEIFTMRYISNFQSSLRSIEKEHSQRTGTCLIDVRLFQFAEFCDRTFNTISFNCRMVSLIWISK